MKLLVVKMLDRKGDKTDFTEIDLAEVNYIDLWRPTNNSMKVFAYHTSDGSYIALYTLKDAATAYHRYGFTPYDKSTLVNVERIRNTVPFKSGTRIYFVDGRCTDVRKIIK